MDKNHDFLKPIHTPVPLIDPIRIRRNIRIMASRAEKPAVRFRPHFKTHQSAAIGEWFREAGVSGITVSSVAMARYFAEKGWCDITIAFPFNVREISALNLLDNLANIHILVDHPDTVATLAAGVTNQHRVFIKVDTGYHRTGIFWESRDEILTLARQIESSARLTFAGILTHAGHSYHCSGPKQVKAVFRETVGRMNRARDFLGENGFQNCKVSIGNTPGCSVADNFEGVDEIRPGNFVFYDLMQLSLGVCEEENLALALLCPVTGIYPDRNEIVVLGGAVHFSEEKLTDPDGHLISGYGMNLIQKGFGRLNREIRLIGLSQEHGIVQAPVEIIRKTRIGDLIGIIPVHSCLTADQFAGYLTTSGDRISRLNSVLARSDQLFSSPENSNSVSF
ncbi:MAG: alanine racemase [Acidobacteria bacterium]|nr:alanine racemase [Acidobacteriota bacterium]